MANNLVIDGNLSVGGTFGSVGNFTVSGNFITGGGTATAVGTNVATLNNKAGIITTQSLTIPAGQATVTTITNNTVTSTDIVFASVQNLTNTGGVPVIGTVTPGAGTLAIAIANASTTGTSGIINGTLKIAFEVHK